jgi:TorA maturation chaperone TorD
MDNTEDEIRAAIERCLDECFKDSSPVAKLAQCAETLRAESWKPEDIRRVEQTVRRMLAALLKPWDEQSQSKQSDAK